MRCPKCGFISFDHLTSCTKCGKDIAEVASELQGTSIKVEAPMFLSGALAAYADREASFEDHAMDAEDDEGIDFSMEDEAVEEEAVEMAETEADVDFSIEEEEKESDISLAEAEAEEAAGTVEEAKEVAGQDFEAEVEEEAAPEMAEKTFEELDFIGAADEEEEGGLEFDLEDFLEDMDDEKPKASSRADVDLDLDDEEK
jgi:hypothetical protein